MLSMIFSLMHAVKDIVVPSPSPWALQWLFSSSLHAESDWRWQMTEMYIYANSKLFYKLCIRLATWWEGKCTNDNHTCMHFYPTNITINGLLLIYLVTKLTLGYKPCALTHKTSGFCVTKEWAKLGQGTNYCGAYIVVCRNMQKKSWFHFSI